MTRRRWTPRRWLWSSLALVLGVLGLVLISGSGSSPAQTSGSGSTVSAFGANSAGELGNGSIDDFYNTNNPTPRNVVGLDGVTAVAGGGTNGGGISLAIRSDGTVWKWGSDYGGAGDGRVSRPVQVKQAGEVPLDQVVAAAAGGSHSLALRADGTVWAWGANECGQLGQTLAGGQTSTGIAVQVRSPSGGGPLTNVRAIAAGGAGNSGHGSSVAVTDDGKVYAWGDNESGQRGNGTVDASSYACLHDRPSEVPLPAGVKAVGVAEGGPVYKRLPAENGGGQVLALTDDGKVYAWGDNIYGQVGKPSSAPVTTPTLVAGLNGKTVTSVAAGEQHSLALIDDGTAYAWGDNKWGQLGTSPVAVGSSADPTQVSGLTGVRQLDGGGAHSLAVTNEGKVYAWGALPDPTPLGSDRNHGQTGPNGPSAIPVEVTGFDGTVSAIAAGANHSLAVSGAPVPAKPRNESPPSFSGEAKEGEKLNGDRGTWSGSDVTFSYQWQRCPAQGSSACADIADATDLDYRLKSDDVGSRVKLVVSASNAGGSTTAASELSATVAAAATPPPPAGGHIAMGFGRNSSAQIGDGTAIDRHAPVGVVGLTNVAALKAGLSHSLALRSDGSVWAWGSNEAGQLGDGTHNDRSVPVPVKLSGRYTVIAPATGGTHNLALRPSDNTVWGWGGTNDCGELGKTGSISRTVVTPLRVRGLESLTVAALAAGGDALGAGDFSLAVTDQGKVYSWGKNDKGQLGNGTIDAPDGSVYGLFACTPEHRHETPAAVSFPAGTRPVVAVSAGAGYSLALTDNGKVYSWGLNTYGQLGRPNSGPSPNAQQVTSLDRLVIAGVAAGQSHSLAWTRDGKVYAWGDNSYGQLGTGEGSAPQSFEPTPVPGINGVKELAAGGAHSLARRADGTVWAWGALTDPVFKNAPYYGQTGSAASATPVQVKRADGTPLDSAIAVAAGGYHSLAAVVGDTPPPPPPPLPSCDATSTAAAARPASRQAASPSPSAGLRAAGASPRAAAAASTATDNPWEQQEQPPLSSPSLRMYAAMAYDAARKQVVLFGGQQGSTELNDTWVWDGQKWKNVTPAQVPGGPPTSPPARIEAVMAYDAASGKVVLFGGTNRSGEVLDDTWTWDGSAWTKEDPTKKGAPVVLVEVIGVVA